MKKQLLLLSLLFSTLITQPSTGPEKLLALLQSIGTGTKPTVANTTSGTPTSVKATIASLSGATTPLTLSRTSSTSSIATTSSDDDDDDDDDSNDNSSNSAPATPRPTSTVTVGDDDNYGSAAHWFQTNDDATTTPRPPPAYTGGSSSSNDDDDSSTGSTTSSEREAELLEEINALQQEVQLLQAENTRLVAALAAKPTVAAPGGPPLGTGTGGPPPPPGMPGGMGGPPPPPGIPGGMPPPPGGMPPPPKAKAVKVSKKKTPGSGGDLLAAIRAGKKLKSGKGTGKGTAKPQKKTLLDALKAGTKLGSKKQRKSAYPKISGDGNSITFKVTKVSDLEKGRISKTDADKYKAMTRFTTEETMKTTKTGSAYQVIKLTLAEGKKWPAELAPLVGSDAAKKYPTIFNNSHSVTFKIEEKDNLDKGIMGEVTLGLKRQGKNRGEYTLEVNETNGVKTATFTIQSGYEWVNINKAEAQKEEDDDDDDDDWESDDD